MDRKPPNLVRNKIAQNILLGLGITAGVALFITSPYSLYYLVRGLHRYALRKSDFHREIKRLRKKEYVSLTKSPQGWLVRLTKKGGKRLKGMQIQNLKILPEPKWDGKWRLFIFDIPETQRSARNLIRKKIKELGLYNFQRSVFVYPFDCREELELLSNYYNLSKYTTYAEADKIDIDRELKKYFKKLIL